MKRAIFHLGSIGSSILLILILFPLIAQERITLSSPETVTVTPINNYRNLSFGFEEDNPNTPADEGVLYINVTGVERDNPMRCEYNSLSNPTGTFLINQLNKANLSTAYAGNATTGSLKQRIYHRLVVLAESKNVCPRQLIGSLTGTPQ